MRREVRKLIVLMQVLVLAILACIKPEVISVYANSSFYVEPVSLTTKSVVSIDDVFGEYMTTVDENIYYSLSSVNSSTLNIIYGDYNTPMFNMAKETINPCMALATTWGEAGSSYHGISLTTVMDFNPDTYVEEIDWITLTSNLEQVDSAWYITHSKSNYNTNEQGHAYHMPTALLQYSAYGSRETSAMTSLGVGPYQITSSNWESYPLDVRVNPIWGYQYSLAKCGTSWIECGITPISDLTVYACLSLGHQGGDLINLDFGRKLINVINQEDVQEAFNYVGLQMLLDAKEKATTGEIDLTNINTAQYLPIVENLTGIDFSDYNASGYGSTNKGNYVAIHCLRYVFYKYYYTSGLDGYDDVSDNLTEGSIDFINTSKLIAQSFKDENGDYSYSMTEGNIPTTIKGVYIDTPYRDCSSYVSAMMLTEYSDRTHMNSYTLNDNLMNWTKLDITTFSELEEGDILVIDGHAAFVVMITASTVYVGDCGSTERIKLTAEQGYSTTYSKDTLISSWRASEVSVYRAQ